MRPVAVDRLLGKFHSPLLNRVRPTATQRWEAQDNHRCPCTLGYTERRGATVHHFGNDAERDETHGD